MLVSKLKEVTFSVVPISILVILLHFSVTPLGTTMLLRFIIGVVFIIIGLTFFLIGVDKAITPLGTLVGEFITKSNKLWLLVIVPLIFGFFISIAEPGLIIFSRQIETVTGNQIPSMTLMVVVSIGIAASLVVAFYRIVVNIPIHFIIAGLYGIVLLLAWFVDAPLLVIAFDASGVTTGVLAVPFILALTVGISHLKRDSLSGEKDSFGTIGIISIGAILAVLFLGLFNRGRTYDTPILDVIDYGDSVFAPYGRVFLNIFVETVLVVTPLIIIFLIFQTFVVEIKLRQVVKIMHGFVYAFLGLLLFLLGVNAGFMDVGRIIGGALAIDVSLVYIIAIAFGLGSLTILAEPAVYVLTNQIEDVTSGYITKIAVLIALSIGVGTAISLSALRIFVPSLQILHFLLPGYFIAIVLMFITPKIFIGMAYDAGGVATGPMTATFIFAFMQGAANATAGSDVILDGFGMIAMVALIPIITLQLLGLIFKIKSKKEGVPNEE